MSNRAEQTIPEGCQSCGVCGVKIDEKDQVHFAFGKPGSRERLYARVCQHVSDGKCINKDDSQLKPLTSMDVYGSEAEGADMVKKALNSASMMSGYALRQR